MARVGVTGAGFVGAALCRRLVADGHDVACLDADPTVRPGAEQAGAAFRHTDITDPAATKEALADRELVVNTAAIVREYGPYRDFVNVNVLGLRNVLDAAEAAGATRTVHLASVAIWAWDFDEPFDEDEPPRPVGSPYFDTKGMSELLARSRGATVVRPGDVYGPASNQWAVRPLEAMKRGMFALPGDGGGLITPVYVDDLVDCIVRALTTPEAADQTFTAWDGNAVPARDFFGHYARMLGQDGIRTGPAPVMYALAAAIERASTALGRPPEITPAALRYLNRRVAYPQPTRARELLGWEAQTTLEEGMRRTEEWFRAEGLLP